MGKVFLEMVSNRFSENIILYQKLWLGTFTIIFSIFLVFNENQKARLFFLIDLHWFDFYCSSPVICVYKFKNLIQFIPLWAISTQSNIKRVYLGELNVVLFIYRSPPTSMELPLLASPPLSAINLQTWRQHSS